MSGTVWKGLKVRYFLGVFQGPGFVDGSPERHQDYVARLQARFFKGFVLGVNASHKLFEQEVTGITRTVNLFGADVRWRFRGLTVQLEGAFGDNPEALVGHELLGGHAILGYRIRLDDDLRLTPAVMAEVVDPDLEVSWGLAVRLAGAVSLDYREVLRVIVYAEGDISPGSYQPALAADSRVTARNRVFLQGNLAL